MPNPLYESDLKLRIQGALAAASNAAAIHHPGLKGAVREILVRELLRPILPPTIAIGTGKIVDHVGNQSGQIDIIIYDRAVLPPLLYGAEGTTGVFPVEACLYAIEVKSRSTAVRLEKAAKQVVSLGSLVYLREVCGPNGNPRWRVMPTYFAFGSNLRAPTDSDQEAPEVTRWRALHDSAAMQWSDALINGVWTAVPHPPIRVLCVAGQGYGYYDGAAYLNYKADGTSFEIEEFIVGVANTLLDFGTRRLALPFGYYLAGPPQRENEPAPGSPEEASNLEDALVRLGRMQRVFDANEALRAVIEDVALRSESRFNEVSVNLTDVMRVLDGMVDRGVLVSAQRATEGGPARWEFVAGDAGPSDPNATD